MNHSMSNSLLTTVYFFDLTAILPICQTMHRQYRQSTSRQYLRLLCDYINSFYMQDYIIFNRATVYCVSIICALSACHRSVTAMSSWMCPRSVIERQTIIVSICNVACSVCSNPEAVCNLLYSVCCHRHYQ